MGIRAKAQVEGVALEWSVNNTSVVRRGEWRIWVKKEIVFGMWWWESADIL